MVAKQYSVGGKPGKSGKFKVRIKERLRTLEKTSKWLKQFNTMERDAANRASPGFFFVLAMAK